MYVLAEHPELAIPSVGDVATELGAETLFDPGDGMQREVRDVRIAAMSVEHFLADLVDGTLVIVPGDRADILRGLSRLGRGPGRSRGGRHPAHRRVRARPDGRQAPGGGAVPRAGGSAIGRMPWPPRVHAVKPLLAPGDERKIASALGAFSAGVDPLELDDRMALERPVRMTPVMFEYELIERAKENRQHIVLPEGDDDRVLAAADILLRRGVVELTILGDPERVAARAGQLGLDLGGANLVDPLESPLRQGFADSYYELRKHKGVTEELALETVGDVTYFGTLMVLAGEADGMVSGAAHTTGETIRPAFEVIKARKGVGVVSSVFLMCLPDRVLVYGDCAVNPKPDVEQLAGGGGGGQASC